MAEAVYRVGAAARLADTSVVRFNTLVDSNLVVPRYFFQRSNLFTENDIRRAVFVLRVMDKHHISADTAAWLLSVSQSLKGIWKQFDVAPDEYIEEQDVLVRELHALIAYIEGT